MVFPSHLPRGFVLHLSFGAHRIPPPRSPLCPLPFIIWASWLQEDLPSALNSGCSLEYSPCLWWKLFFSLLGATNILRLVMSLIVLLQVVPLQNNQPVFVSVHGKLLSQLQSSELIAFGQLGSCVCTRDSFTVQARRVYRVSGTSKKMWTQSWFWLVSSNKVSWEYCSLGWKDGSQVKPVLAKYARWPESSPQPEFDIWIPTVERENQLPKVVCRILHLLSPCEYWCSCTRAHTHTHTYSL